MKYWLCMLEYISSNFTFNFLATTHQADIQIWHFLSLSFINDKDLPSKYL